MTYTWCHGPTGTSHLFAALSHAGVEEVAGFEVAGLRQRCLHSVLVSGVPQRVRPGFWDNDGVTKPAAGIAAYLMRLARVVEDERSAQAVDRPDQWWAVPAHLRTVHS